MLQADQVGVIDECIFEKDNIQVIWIEGMLCFV